MNGLSWSQLNQRVALASRQTGAMGRNCSHYLISFRRTRVLSSNGAASMDLILAARGPISYLPLTHLTIRPRLNKSATSS